MVRRSLKVEKRKGRDTNFEDFYFTHVEDALNKLIDSSKSKVASYNKQDCDLKGDHEGTPSKSFVSPAAPTEIKGSILKRWKFI